VGTDVEDDSGDEHGDQRGAEAEVEVGVIADGADDAGTDGVTESVDDEELTGHGGGADLWTDGVERGRVDWAGAKEDEEDGNGEAGQSVGFGAEEVLAEEADERGRDGDGCADGGNEIEGFGIRARPFLRDDAAGDGASEAGDYGDGSHEECGGGLAAAVDALEERWHPPGDASEGEGDGGVAEDGAEIGLVPDEGEDCVFFEFGLVVLAGSAGGFLHEEGYENRDDCAGDCGDDEGHAPAEVFTYGASDEIAEGCAYWDGHVEDGEDAVALVFGVEVREDGGGEDAETGFANAEGRVADVERVVGVDGRGEEVDAAPEKSGDDDHGLARETVAQPSGDGRREHVGEHEPESERADLGVGDVELAFDLLLHTGQDVAVDVVDEVEGGEEDESRGGSGNGGVTVGFGCGGHLCGKDSSGALPGA
jgi:hypothetical protein